MYRNLLAMTIVFLSVTQSFAESNERKPNVIVILADDLGYGDLSCYGADDIATPNIDRMAAEGAKFSSFYVSAVCSPTRASLMTGSHSTRVGIGGVLFPRNNHGLNPDEITLPELLKAQGYATAIIGKWHLGNQDMFQPLNHGFDYWYGTPSSNSQFYYPTIKKYAADCVFREGYTRDGILEARDGGMSADSRQRRHRSSRGPDAVHSAVHARDHSLHHRKQRQAVLCVPGAQHAAHPAACFREVCGQQQTRHLRRHDSGTRLEHRRDSAVSERTRAR